MKKKITVITSVIAVIALVMSVYISAFARSINWYYDENTKTIYVYGNRAMDDYTQAYEAPWNDYIREAENFVVRKGVTSVGDYAMAGAVSLKSVTLADSVTSIGSSAFASTPLLNSLTFSENVSVIKDVSFSKDGTQNKSDFTLYVTAGSFALNYAITNGVNFNCPSVKICEHKVEIKSNTSMKAYYPFIPTVSGTFSFYSVSNDDPMGYVYDSEFNQIGYNDDHGSLNYNGMSDCDFAISINLTQGETYYLATNIYSPSSSASYKVNILPTSYTVSGNICAIISDDKTLSGNLTDATLNGNATNGTYSITVTNTDNTGVFSCDGVSYTHTFKPEDGNSVDINIVICDRNSDGIVNAKDYVYMKKSNSQYIQYFSDLINFKYNENDCYTVN